MLQSQQKVLESFPGSCSLNAALCSPQPPPPHSFHSLPPPPPPSLSLSLSLTQVGSIAKALACAEIEIRFTKVLTIWSSPAGATFYARLDCRRVGSPSCGNDESASISLLERGRGSSRLSFLLLPESVKMFLILKPSSPD